uniref:Lysophospholipid acyltransferase 5 n=1 Tax=Magallana gigas TaxID=29159 RepID=K1RCL3_MAGGI
MSGVLDALASQIGASVEATIFLLSLFIGYPLGFFHRAFIHGKDENIHHVFFTATGLAVYYFNFGLNFIHPIANILVIYLYLLYSYVESVKLEGYSITWSTPQCVLTLRLTALVLDYYDGKKSQDKLSKDQKENFITDIPSLLAIFGQCFYVGGMLAGPQFGIRKYLAFTRGEFSAIMAKDASPGMKDHPPASVGPALTRLALGILYIVLFQTGNMLFSDEYFFTAHYQEGISILMGLSYNGKDKNGNILWDGVSNVKLYQQETCSTFREAIEAFNYNTNKWMFSYIYRRLQFLGSKSLSQAVTLSYLAMWHGLASGYYMNFFLEFIMVNTENQIMVLEYRIPLLHEVNRSPTLQPFLWLVRRILLTFSISYALVSFCMLTHDKYLQIYSSVGYVGHVVYLGFPLVYLVLIRLFKTPKKTDRKE